MVATFVVEDGTGKANANAYATEAFVDGYHDNYGAPVAWTGLAAGAVREHHIREATQYLEATYGLRWHGQRTNRLQALDWPRKDIFDADGFSIDSNVMPAELLEATAIMALKSAEAVAATPATVLIPDLTKSGTEAATLIKVGPITKSVRYSGGNSPVKKFRVVNLLLKRLVKSSTIITRG